MSGITETPLPDMSGIPPWMVTLLEYPYLAGSKFVSQLYSSGGWDAVNAVYADLPASSEQVLHPAKYLSREAPMPVASLDLRSALGSGWTSATDSTMGEAWISTWLEGLGVKAGAAEVAAAGWGGDRLTAVTGPGGAWALAWRMAWDAPAEATQFETTYTGIESSLAFPARVVHAADGGTVVLQASSAEVLAQIAALAGS
jgi:hypothetical protein